MIQLGFRNHTYSPQVQCTDSKATESPISKMRGGGGEGDTEEQNGEKENLWNERINKVGIDLLGMWETDIHWIGRGLNNFFHKWLPIVQ